MRVYAIRHGESESNLARLWTGWSDPHLTEGGRRDAENAKALLSGIAFDRVYASDLIRARETAAIALPGCEPILSKELREVNVGFLAGKPYSDPVPGDTKDGYADFGGETIAEFTERARAFLASLEGGEEENIALFTHAGFLRRLLAIALGAEIPTKNLLCKNCAALILERRNGVWCVYSWINFDRRE